MGRKKQLSDFEKGQIAAFHKAGFSSRKIAKQIGRSPNVVNNFLNLGSKYGEKKSTGRPRKLTKLQERLVIKELKDGETLSRLSRDPNFSVHKSTLSRVVKRIKSNVNKKKKNATQAYRALPAKRNAEKDIKENLTKKS